MNLFDFFAAGADFYDRILSLVAKEIVNKATQGKSMATIAEYAALIEVKTCRWCGTRLPKTDLQHYDHEGGYEVQGFAKPQWLYVHCQKCGYDWSLWKLGVPRQ